MFSSHPYQVIAYFTEWSSFTAKDLITSESANKITIINYSFGLPSPNPVGKDILCPIDNPELAYGKTYSAAESVDGLADDPLQPLRGHFNQLKKLKALYPHLKIVVSLGGWTGSGWFSNAARTVESRQKFVRNCLDLWILGNLPVQNGAGGPGTGAGVFDGIDIDWEYPVGGGLPDNHTDQADGANFVLLLQEFRKQFAEIGRPELLLTMAGPGPGQAGNYNLNKGHIYLDFVSIMAYDFRGAWSKLTGHHTNLCGNPNDPGGLISADQTVQFYHDTLGIPAQQLVLGAAFYGKSWRNVPDTNHGLFQTSQGSEESSENYRNLPGKLNHGFTRYWDDLARAPYLYSLTEQIFWTYDDPQSLALKAQYVRYFGLGGMMFWEISGDDAQGTLITAIDQNLANTAPVDNPCR
jgi:chitinase